MAPLHNNALGSRLIIMFIGTKASEKLSELITNTNVCKDIVKLSLVYQTSILETFHCVVIHFSPKYVPLSYFKNAMQIHEKLYICHHTYISIVYILDCSLMLFILMKMCAESKLFPKYKKGRRHIVRNELGTSQVSTTDDADKPDISLAIQSHKSHFIPYT